MTRLPSSLAVRLAGLAILAHLTMSGVTLTLLGDPYIEDGGALIFKIHPGSYIAYAAGGYASARMITSRGVAWCWMWTHRAIIVSVVCLGACVVLELIFTGTSNPIVLIDTFLPACFLLLVLSDANLTERLLIGKILLVGFAANALIAVCETVSHSHLLSPLAEYRNDFDREDEFRAIALYDHPLTGAAASAIGLMIAPLLRNTVSRIVYCLLMLGAIISFGGRVALGTGVIALVFPHVSVSIRALILRHRSAPWLLIANFSIIIMATTVFGIALLSGFAARLQNHLYWDPSAQVRLDQWHILDSLTAVEWLFGTRRADLLAYLHKLDLSSGVQVVECFWLLLFTTLGIIGFPLFVAGLMTLLMVCWHRATAPARAMIGAVLLIASTSNSLGRKSPLVLLLVAACSTSRIEPRLKTLGGHVAQDFAERMVVV